MVEWAYVRSQKSSAKAKTYATSFAKVCQQPIELYAGATNHDFYGCYVSIELARCTGRLAVFPSLGVPAHFFLRLFTD